MRQNTLLQEEDLPRSNFTANKIEKADHSVHEWYRFVLSFPPHLVRHYLDDFKTDKSSLVLDPFCGTGTTVVESKINGIPAIGIEANPMAHFATRVKANWTPDPEGLTLHASEVAGATLEKLKRDGISDDFYDDGTKIQKLRTLSDESLSLLLTDSISPTPLHKSLVLLECIRKMSNGKYTDHELLALAKTLVYSASNLKFGPEVGVERPKTNAPVVTAWLTAVKTMAEDIKNIHLGKTTKTRVTVIRGDARTAFSDLKAESVDAVITSPPYPNEKDYTRTTRLESVILGFIRNKDELRKLKESMLRSNTRGVYKNDDDDKWITDFPEIQRIANAIEKRRIELGKTSGFERLYHRVTKLYFGGMARHLSELRSILRPGARLAYVVGDQASYLRVMIRTGKILAHIAERLGYEVDRIDLFRTRLATATKEQLREEVVILRWPGKKAGSRE